MIKNKFIKFLIFILIIINLSSCYTRQILFAIGDNKDWDVYDVVSGIDGVYHINIESKNNNLIGISISGLNQNKKEEACEDLFYIDFGTLVKKENINEIKKYFENNELTFDTSKLFIIKNGKKYKINLYNSDYDIYDTNKNIIHKSDNNSNEVVITNPNYKFTKNFIGQDEVFNLSNEFLRQLNYKSFNKYNYLIVEKTFSYKTNLSCKFLENSTLLIEGLSLNGKLFSPIKIDLTYKKPKNHMGQEDYYKLKNISL